MAESRFKDFLLKLAEDIGQDELPRMVKMCGGFTPSIISMKDRQTILQKRNVYGLFEKLVDTGHISKTNYGILVQLLRKVGRQDLVEETRVRFKLGFDKEVSEDEYHTAVGERRHGLAKHGRSTEIKIDKSRLWKPRKVTKPPQPPAPSPPSSPLPSPQPPGTKNVFGIRKPSMQTEPCKKSHAVQAEEALLKSRKTVQTKRGRVMIVGQFGVGKTSLKRSLFGEKFNPVHDSTRGIESVRFSIDISNFFAVAGKSKGSPTQMAMRKLLADEMRDLLETKKEAPARPTPNHKFTTPQDVEEETTEPLTPTIEEEKAPLIRKDTTAADGNDVELPNLLSQLVLENEDEQNLLENLNLNETGMDMESFCDFGLWDFAGQSVYYTTHQVFLDNKSIFLLVADASRDLDDECPMDKCESREEQQCWKKKMKYKDYLSFWLNSIHTCSKKSTKKFIIGGHEYMAPLVILVATKKDKIGSRARQEEFIQEMRLYLAEACEEAFDAHVFQETFIVDNSRSGTGEEDAEIQGLRECLKTIADDPIFTENVPVQWLRLELVLKAMRDLNKHVVTISFFEQYAAKLGITDSVETEKILEYFHTTGITYHFEGLLVLEAKWLAYILGRVISIKLGDVPIKHPKKERFLIDLRRHGILHEELLGLLLDDRQRNPSRSAATTEDDFRLFSNIIDPPEPSPKQDKESGAYAEIWQRRSVVMYMTNDNNRPNGQSQTDGGQTVAKPSRTSEGITRVIELLKHFDLIYPLTSKGASAAYIVPSLLQLDRLETLPIGDEKSYHTLPLYYHFSGGFLPEGFYYRLVVRCLEEWGKESDGTSLRKNLKYHHADIPVSRRHRMSLTKRGSDVIMIMWYFTSERTFQPLHPKPDPKKCRDARIFVEETMNDIIATWMPSLRYEAKVICSCKSHKAKYEDEDSEKWIGSSDFVYHDVKVDPPYQVTKKDDDVPEMDLREESAQNRKYIGPYKVQCTEMPCMMDLEPVKAWFGVSKTLKMAASGFLERMPKLGVVAFVCVVVVFIWVVLLGVQSAVIPCKAMPSVAGILILIQCIVIFLILICGFAMAIWLCIFYSRNDEEYRNVRALFLVTFTMMFFYLPRFISEIEKLTEECS